MKTTAVVGVAIIFTLAGVVTWNVGRAANKAGIARVAIAHEAAVAARRTRLAEQRLATTQREEAHLRAVLAGVEKTKTAEEVVPPAKPPPASISEQALENKLAESRERARNPRGQILELARSRAGYYTVYGTFFRKEGLSQEQIERFIDIRIKNLEVDFDLDAIVRQGLVSSKDPAVAKFKADARAEADAASREVLGDAGYQRLLERRKQSPMIAQHLVGKVAADAVLAGAPFNASQLEHFVQIVANSSSSYRNGQSVEYGDIDWDLVDTQVRPLMSEAQWTLFKTSSSPGSYSVSYSRFLATIAKAAQADAAGKAATAARAVD